MGDAILSFPYPGRVYKESVNVSVECDLTICMDPLRS